ncbi:ubiquitin-like domain-containing protein, partial [Christensenellaceae bacterium OttesenSCG-928-L17]|nr:ubiquitin-like domain-containing protein [Christensenellaceae bacterium OttesenSCG-928-L17]
MKRRRRLFSASYPPQKQDKNAAAFFAAVREKLRTAFARIAAAVAGLFARKENEQERMFPEAAGDPMLADVSGTAEIESAPITAEIENASTMEETAQPEFSAQSDDTSTSTDNTGIFSRRPRQLKDVALLTGMALSLVLFLFALFATDIAVDIVLTMNGQSRTYHTKAETVADFLERSGLVLKEGDALNVAMDEELHDGMVISVTSAFPVAVASKGEVQVLRMREGSVGEALLAAGVTYDADDELSQLIYQDVAPGMHIQHVDVEVEYEAKNVRMEYREEVIRNDKQYNTYSVVKVEGKDGEKRVVRKLVYKDGELFSREIMQQVTLVEPVTQVKEVGTQTRYQTKYSGDTRLWKAAPTESEIKKTLVASEITAYTHTGNTTATGKRPRIGYVAVNPNVIPYGTKLYIPGYGYCTAQDTGAFRHEEGGMKNQIDVFLNTASEC